MRSFSICLTGVLSINERGLVKVVTPENFPGIPQIAVSRRYLDSLPLKK